MARIAGVVLLFFSVISLISSTHVSNIYNELDDIYNSNELFHVRKKLEQSNISFFTQLKMIDASSKLIFPTGLINGNFFDLGNFDECYNIVEGNVYGKYCLGVVPLIPQAQKYLSMLRPNITKPLKSMQIHPQLRIAGLGPTFMGIHVAVCIPSSMKADEIGVLVKYYEEFCYSKNTEPELSTGAIATLTLLALILVIIIFSTTYDIFLYYQSKKPYHELYWEQNRAHMFIMGATVSVDTFFVVGGLVTVYTFLKSMDKGVKFNILLYYLHRYLRLTPALGIMVLIHAFILPYLSKGPLWKIIDYTLVQTCKKAWWSILLYVTNYVRDGVCVPQAWYLTVDMQLFILSPIVLLLLVKWPSLGLVTLEILALAGVIVPFMIGYAQDIGTMFNSEKYMTDYYMQTYARFGPYVIGLILGYIIYMVKKRGRKFNLRRLKIWKFNCPADNVLALIFWAISLGGLTACVYGTYDINNPTAQPDKLTNALFLGLYRPSWSVALGLAILLCVTGYGGPINAFLSLPIFQVITKLSYSMYLVHYCVISVRYAAMKTVFQFSNLEHMHIFWGDFMFTLFFSLILCLSFESPIIIIEKHLFGRGTTPPKKKQPEV